jgi:hypothetical protein
MAMLPVLSNTLRGGSSSSRRGSSTLKRLHRLLPLSHPRQDEKRGRYAKVWLE